MSLAHNTVLYAVDIRVLGKQDLLLTASADKTARVWKLSDEGAYSCAAVLKEHSSEVSAAAVHVTNDYFVTASLDKTWCFYDAATTTCLQQVAINLSHCCSTSFLGHIPGLAHIQTQFLHSLDPPY